MQEVRRRSPVNVRIHAAEPLSMESTGIIMEEGFMKNTVQRFGKFLSAMVMPNIGALIAFGFLAALFIDTGWIPNKGFNSMVSPMLTYLIPILIASTFRQTAISPLYRLRWQTARESPHHRHSLSPSATSLPTRLWTRCTFSLPPETLLPHRPEKTRIS